MREMTSQATGIYSWRLDRQMRSVRSLSAMQLSKQTRRYYSK